MDQANAINIELYYINLIKNKMINLASEEINEEIINIINLSALDMYKVYKNDNELNELKDGEDDWFREFMNDKLFKDEN